MTKRALSPTHYAATVSAVRRDGILEIFAVPFCNVAKHGGLRTTTAPKRVNCRRCAMKLQGAAKRAAKKRGQRT